MTPPLTIEEKPVTITHDTHDTHRAATHDLAPGHTRQDHAATVRFLGRASLEVTIITALYLLYNAGRLAARGHEAAALSHANLIHHLELALHLPSEAGLQNAVASVPHLFEMANRYYVSVHFPLMIAFLLWGFLFRPRSEYLWARNVLIVLTFLALLIQMGYPLAPPRMFPQWGFTDTMNLFGPSAYNGASGAVANQHAAMPSLHIGWALLIAVVIVRTGPRPLAIPAVLHAVTTVFVVVVTANHWWLDGVVAATLLSVALVIFPKPGQTRLPRSTTPSEGATSARRRTSNGSCRSAGGHLRERRVAEVRLSDFRSWGVSGSCGPNDLSP
jgi:PAP2 superfamily